MKEVDIEAINDIIQLEIANFIKQHRNMNKKELIKEIEEMLDKKEKLINSNEEEYKKILKNKES